MQKVLSVSVASYNVEGTLAQALDSFLSVDILPRVEVLVVDDGSSDETAAIAERYVQKYPDSFRLLQKKNGGYGSTINTSLPLATGRYYRLLDGDDWFEPKALASLLDALESCEDDIVLMTGFVECYENTGERRENRIGIPPGSGYGFEVLQGAPYIGHHRAVFRRDCLQARFTPLLEHCFYTDDQYMLQGFLGGKTIAVVESSPYCYRLAFAGQSVSLEGFAKHYLEGARCFDAMCGAFREAGLGEGDKRNFVLSFLAIKLQSVIGMYLCLDVNDENRRKLRAFWKETQARYPDVASACRAKKVLLLRYSGFLLYRPLALAWQRKHRK